MAEENGEWVDSLPEGIREWDEVKNSDSPDKFWKQMGDLRSYAGGALRIPGQDASDDDRAAFYAKVMEKVPGMAVLPGQGDTEGWARLYDKLGRPQDPTGYKLDGATEDQRAFYHGIGLSQAQAARIMEAEKEAQNQKNQSIVDKVKGEVESLKSEWGDAEGRKMHGIKTVLDRFDKSGELTEALKDPDFQFAPQMLRFLGMVGDQFVESKPPSGGGEGWGITPQEAQSRIDEIYANDNHPARNPNHPNHKAAAKELQRLFEAAHPGDAA